MLVGTDDSEALLMRFYGLLSLEPRSLADVTVPNIVFPSSTQDKPSATDMATEREANAASGNVLGGPQSDADATYKVLLQLIGDSNGPESATLATTDVDPLDGVPLSRKMAGLELGNTTREELLPSSKEFDPIAFLTTVHQTDTLDQLCQSLNYLENNIVGQAKELQGLIDTKYLHFVKAKIGINEVLEEFRWDETAAVAPRSKFSFQDPEAGRGHARFDMPRLEENIKLLQYNSSLSLKPIIDNQAKITKMELLVRFVEQNRFFFDLPALLSGSIARNDHEAVIHNLQKYHALKEAYLGASGEEVDGELSRAEGLAALQRVWLAADAIVAGYRQQLQAEVLAFLRTAGALGGASAGAARLGLLLERLQQLGLQTKPLRQLVEGQMESIAEHVRVNFERLEGKLRQAVALQPEAAGPMLGCYGKYFTDGVPSRESLALAEDLDAPAVIGIYNALLAVPSYLSGHLVPEMGRLRFNVRFLRDAYAAEAGEDAMELVHLGIERLVLVVCERLEAVFCAPVAGAANGTVAAYGFLPRHTNAASALVYITQISTTVAECLSQLAALGLTPRAVERLRDANAALNVRLLEAVCLVWIEDALRVSALETFEIVYPSTGLEDAVTSLPRLLLNFLHFALAAIQSMVYWTRLGSYEIKVVALPSKKILVAIATQLEITLRKAVESIMTRTILLDRGESRLGAGASLRGTYKVVTMNNLASLRTGVYPAVVAYFDELFRESLARTPLKVYLLLERFEMVLFDNYIEKEKATVKELVAARFAAVFAGAPVAVSNYVFAVLSHLTRITTSIEPVSPREHRKIVLALQAYFLRLVVDHSRAHGAAVTADACLQLEIDLAFFRAVFQRGTLQLSPACLETMNQTIVGFRDRVEPLPTVATRNPTPVAHVVDQALAESDVAFACFKL